MWSFASIVPFVFMEVYWEIILELGRIKDERNLKAVSVTANLVGK
jgi:hypothetical protein